MSYALLLDQENVQESFLIVMTPRRLVSNWTVVSGFVYKASWFYVKPTSFEFDGVVQTEVTTSTPNASEWYWNSATNEIYFRTGESADPDTGMSVAFYPLYVASSGIADTNWYSDPVDASTDQVHFEPVIRKSPDIKITTGDTLFGYFPVQSSTFELINAEHFLEEHLYDSSFNSASVKIYHALGTTLRIENIALVYDGIMSDVTYTSDRVTIKTLDRVDKLAVEFRNEDASFFSVTDFPTLNPNAEGKPIRYVYGYVRGFKPINIQYVREGATTSDNRQWVVVGEQTGLAEIVRTVGASSTTTRTFVDFVEGIQVGDTVWLDRGGTDAYVVVSAVNISPAYIDHAAILTPMDPGDFVRKGFVSRVDVVQNNISYTCFYGRDYTINDFAVGTRGFTFSTSLEANTGLPATLSVNDTVHCTVYGRVNDLTAGGPTFGANDPYSNNITNPVMVLYDLLKRVVGFSESEMDLTQFAAIRTATASEGLGFAIPETSDAGFPNVKATIISILGSSLLRLFINNELKWTIEQLAPLESASNTIDSNELPRDFSYKFEHRDIVSDVLVEYAGREVPESPGANQDVGLTVTATSAYARHVHKVVKQQAFDSLHFRSDDAQTLADRLSFYLGDRKGLVEFTAPGRFFNTLINDTVTVSRDGMPGFEYIRGTERSIDFGVVEINKNLRGIKLDLEDQKGIQDNQADW